jgi:outer membrane receptor protein involved in Fe transport
MNYVVRPPISVCPSLAAASLLAFAAPIVASAQAARSASESLEEVIVTARKIAESPDRISASIAVLSREQLDTEGVRQIADALRLVPGLSYEYGGWPTDQRASIRGLQSERGRPSVAVLVDGLDISSENLYVFGGGAALNTRLLDLERVEVVKGPQTVLYGRNAFGGAINYVTRRPNHDEFDLDVRGDLGWAGLADVEIGAGGPFGDERFAWRAFVASHDFDGYYTNPSTGGELGASESLSGSLALSFKPNESLAILARYQYSDDAATQAPQAYIAPSVRVPVPGATLTPMGAPCPPGNVATPCGRGVFDGTIEANESNLQLSRNLVTGEDFPGYNSEQQFASLQADASFGVGTLTALAGWFTNNSDTHMDGDFADYAPTLPPPNVQVGFATREVFEAEHASQEVRYAWSTERWSGLVGVLHYDETYKLQNLDDFYLLNPNSPLRFPSAQFPNGINPRPRANPPFPLAVTRDTQHWSAFARISYRLAEAWQFTIAGRYSDDQIDYAQGGFTRQNVALFNQVPSCPPAPRGSSNCGISASVDSTEFTPKYTLEYFGRNLLGERLNSIVAYVTYAEAFKPAGFNTNEIVSYDEQRYEPEQLQAWEIGARSVWLDRSLRLNGALFYQDYTDQQIGTQRLPPGAVFPVSGITNAAKVESYGAELEIIASPTERWDVSFSYAYTRATFKDFVYGANGRVASTQQQAESQTLNGDFSGNDVGRNAPHALNVLARYSLPAPGAAGDWGNARWVLEAEAQHRSRRYVDEANLAELPAYTIANVRAGLMTDRWSVLLYLDNAFDEDAIQTAQRYVDVGTPDNFVPRRSYLALLPEPRTYGVRVAWSLR